MSSKKNIDTAVATTPAARTPTFSGGMPSFNPATDEAVGTVTSPRPDVFNLPAGTGTPTPNPGDF